MPRELRYIAFPQDELVVALLDFARRRRKPLPPGYVRRLLLEREPMVSCKLVIRREGTGQGADRHACQDQEVAFEQTEVAAALVLACMKSCIPVPATRLRKSLQVLDGQVALVISSRVPVGRAKVRADGCDDGEPAQLTWAPSA